jgi:hypothetical protein
MAKCKRCGEEIIWIEMVSGRKMPCDPKLIPYKWGGMDWLVTDSGCMVECAIIKSGAQGFAEENGMIDGWGYIPHRATCKGVS